jgi:hypothetical protein
MNPRRRVNSTVRLLRLRNGNLMKRIRQTFPTVLLVVVAVLCAASESLAQSAPKWSRFKRVSYLRSETRRNLALERAILRSLPSYSEEIWRIHESDPSVVPSYLVRYFYNRVDLNDDGRPETLVWLA